MPHPRDFGLVNVAAASPRVHLADPAANAREICDLLDRAQEQACEVVCFPELCLTGYTCGDLFGTDTLLDAAVEALHVVRKHTEDKFGGLAVVGLPLRVEGRLYNVAAVLQDGEMLGVVPKQYLPTYREFYESRHFARGRDDVILESACADALGLGTKSEDIYHCGADLLFVSHVDGGPPLVLGVEICEDLWVPHPPSGELALQGANVVCNPSAGNETIGKEDYRRDLVRMQSGRCICAYVYANTGHGESTTDVVYSGVRLICENGRVLAESDRFERRSALTVATIDLAMLETDRGRLNTFQHPADHSYHVHHNRFHVYPTRPEDPPFHRTIDAHPFVPADGPHLADRCRSIFAMQVTALASRLEHAGIESVQIGVSGGLDSTLALLVAVRTFDELDLPRSGVHGLTMPGFGTSERTLANSRKLMEHLGVTAAEADIRQLCLDAFRAQGHAPFGIDVINMSLDEFAAALDGLPAGDRHDLTFENTQARVRTMLLMNRGFVVGTGDLSEQALGWSTYNADHMSMYNPNAGVPKTLVKFLVSWVAAHEADASARPVLQDVVGTEISPELLPALAGVAQSTQDTIGPYELHDFFLYHFVRHGSGPAKIAWLAERATGFDRDYSQDEIVRWLRVFLTRFFANQFKRSCVPDGPKVGTVSLSPRGDWRMPSDADAAAWLAELDAL